MNIKKCFAKGLPAVLLIAFLNIVLLVPGNAAVAESSAPSEAATAMIDRTLQVLAENAEEYQTYVDMIEDYLPADSAMLLHELLFISQLDLTPEVKQAAVIEISQSACSAYLRLWIFGEILGYFTVFDDLASLLSDIGLLGIFLCLLGIGLG
jgi:hypothetical protein